MLTSAASFKDYHRLTVEALSCIIYEPKLHIDLAHAPIISSKTIFF